MQHATRLQSFPKSVTDTARIGIVRSTFNGEMTERLEESCRATLTTLGITRDNIASYPVAGALEIPVVVNELAITKKYDALIALGVVVKGDTYHFELVASECARKCSDIAVQCGIPVIQEVLAVYTPEQAEARTANDEFNKGIEAAQAALASITTLQLIRQDQPHE